MSTTSLGIHYYIKDGHRDTVLSKLKGVIDHCAKEPEFINAIISESPERPNQFALRELWRGTRADFDAVQGIKPYRKAYLADVKQYLEKVDVEWNTPIVEWGLGLTDLNGALGSTNMAPASGTADEGYRPTRRAVVIAFAATALSMSPVPVSGLIHELRQGDVPMAQTIETLLRENIHGVFSEPDSEKRRKNITRLWAEDGVFIDPDSRCEGHSGIALAAEGVVKKFPNFIFTERDEIVAYNRIGKLDWGFGPAGAEAVVTGSDVLVMKGDKIGALYTFVYPPKKETKETRQDRASCGLSGVKNGGD